MPREKLILLIKLMFLTLAMAFTFVLFRSLSGPSNFSNTVNLFDDIEVGQTAVRRAGREKVWVTRLSPQHADQAKEVAPFVVDEDAGCDAQKDLCVLVAAAQRRGIDLIYSADSPPQLRSKVVWHGGFVDPSTGEVFDRLGRAYLATAERHSNVGRTELPQLRLD